MSRPASIQFDFYTRRRSIAEFALYRLAKLAVMERVEAVMLYIAAIAARFAPGTQPWSYLLRHLPPRLPCPPDALAHWSRFVSQTGVTSFAGGPDIKWLRRREPEE
jgi:hypothetical protein